MFSSFHNVAVKLDRQTDRQTISTPLDLTTFLRKMYRGRAGKRRNVKVKKERCKVIYSNIFWQNTGVLNDIQRVQENKCRDSAQSDMLRLFCITKQQQQHWFPRKISIYFLLYHSFSYSIYKTLAIYLTFQTVKFFRDSRQLLYNSAYDTTRIFNIGKPRR